MKERPSRKSNSFEVVSLLALLALAPLWVVTPLSMAQQDNRQLQREQSQSVVTQRRIALVIGNGAYKTVPPLKNPPNDATLLAATLRKLGFEVVVGTNKSQREMKQLIREFGQKLRGGGGVGLFYFAGHGVQARGRNYLIPIDADIQTEADLEDVAVDVNYVLNTMDDAKNALNIAILDACRNNPFARSFRSAQEGLAQLKAPTGTLIAYATAPDSVAADGGGANSPYAEELTKQIQVSGVLLETMFRRVAERVSSRSAGRQEPWYSANVKGDFYFNAGPTNLSTLNRSETTQPAKIDPVAIEREYWETIRNSKEVQDYKDYLQAYPSGAYAAIARTKVKQLEAPIKTRPDDSQTNNTLPSDINSISRPTNSEASSEASLWPFKVNVKVRADNINNGWTNSGFVVLAGQAIRISASGRVSLGKGRLDIPTSQFPDGSRSIFSPPAGLSTVRDSNKLMPNVPTGGLIAVIGDDNNDFIFVGASRQFIALRNGVVFLGVNEGNLTDNTGSYAATIEAQAINPSTTTSEIVIKEPFPEILPKSLATKVNVRADNVSNGWTNSGVFMQAGQKVRITATGKVSLGKGRSSSPAGLSNIGDSNKLMRLEPTGALIAVIGDDNNDFIFIGAEREFIVQRNGLLFLGVNEGKLTDNNGYYEAVVTVAQ